VKLLALDTSTHYCSVALWIDGIVEVREVDAGQRHSELLLRMIDELLAATQSTLRDLDGIAYGEGPGSFTGLRIACGVVQGIAFGANVPVLGVGTLLAMAEGSGAGRVVCCVDARVQEIYHAAYVRADDAGSERGVRTGPRRAGGRGAASWHVVHPPRVCSPADAPLLEGEAWYACGSGFSQYEDVLTRRYANQLAEIDSTRYPHARDIAALAAPRFEAGEGESAELAVPVYLREKVALRIDERASR
jgi:tRNA threonylcarbamoyladenosine biosynthesis protein TsaB